MSVDEQEPTLSDEAESRQHVAQHCCTLYQFYVADHIRYQTAEEAAIALAQLCRIIAEGERAKTDLFG